MVELQERINRIYELFERVKTLPVMPSSGDYDVRYNQFTSQCVEMVQIIRLLETENANLARLVVREIQGITLGSDYIGKITEKEAIDLINTVIKAQHSLANSTLIESIDGDMPQENINDFLNKEK